MPVFDGETPSDHAPFWDNNLSAIGIGKEHHTDFYPYWHTYADSIAHFNLSFYQKCSKLAYATIAEFALDTVNFVSVIEADRKSGIDLYPNPFKSTLSIRLQEEDFSHVKILITDCFGRTVFETVSEEKLVHLYLHYLEPGAYFIKISN